MGYRNLTECVKDIEGRGELVRISHEVDANLEVGAIQRRVYQAGGPALLFTNVKGCRFPMLGNLFGTMDRIRFLFRDTLETVRRLVELKVHPAALLRDPPRFLKTALAGPHLVPKRVVRGAVLANKTTLQDLPHLKSWPRDGGAFITLPQVYSESPVRGGFRLSNLGMYRVQISGGQYAPGREVGVHYQIHRGLGVHHAEAIGLGVPLRVNISVGGPPSLTVAAVMPLPEGLPELSFAGLLGGHRVRMVCRPDRLPVPAEADFCITGTIDPKRTLPEGPFGDHLGYYSLVHDFPVMGVEEVYCRNGAIWPFTTVGRPPQEDTTFGRFIHELTGPLVPVLIPGLRGVHAVEAAGVHPLLLAVGSERYVPYAKERRPQELLTIANAILGEGQLSLAKYLLIVAHEDRPDIDVQDVPGFLQNLLERVDWRSDLHFQTRTTVDTLDYTGGGLNEGSKLVIATAGPRRQTLSTVIPSSLHLPPRFDEPSVCLPGILVIKGPPCHATHRCGDPDIEAFCGSYQNGDPIQAFSLVVIVDDSEFAARTLDNFLWVTFTRSDPASDVYGIGAFTHCRHWGCAGPLVIDARTKPHHAPPLMEDPAVQKRVDALGVRGAPLHGIV